MSSHILEDFACKGTILGSTFLQTFDNHPRMNQVYRLGVSNSKTGSVRGIGMPGVGFEVRIGIFSVLFAHLKKKQ